MEAMPFRCLAVSPSDKVIAALDNHGGIQLWDAAGQHIGALPCEGWSYCFLRFSPDGKRLASGIEGIGSSEIKIWDFIYEREVMSMKSLPGEIRSLAFTRDGNRLVTSTNTSGDKNVFVWDATPIKTNE